MIITQGAYLSLKTLETVLCTMTQPPAQQLVRALMKVVQMILLLAQSQSTLRHHLICPALLVGSYLCCRSKQGPSLPCASSKQKTAPTRPLTNPSDKDKQQANDGLKKTNMEEINIKKLVKQKRQPKKVARVGRAMCSALFKALYICLGFSLFDLVFYFYMFAEVHA